MATIASNPARIYVGTDKVKGMAIGLDAKRNVYLHQDKNLRLAIFVPERARASDSAGASHVATGVSRAAYHQLRACSAQSSRARQSAALQTAQDIFSSVAGLAEKASALSPALKMELAKQMADGRFKFAYQELPETLQGQALALEVAGGPGDLALWHQSLIVDGLVAREDGSPSTLAAAAQALCGASTSADRARVREDLVNALVQANMEVLEGLSASLAGVAPPGGAADTWTESLCAQKLASLALTPTGHLMPGAFLGAMAKALRDDSVPQSDPPAPALRQFLASQLTALATQPELRQSINSISAPPPENGVIEDQLRADLVIPPPAELKAADARQAVLRALLTPLRQGDVGSCFATSIAIRQQIDRPQVMVAQLKTMIERGYIEGRSGIRTERLPLNPGLGQSSPLLSSDPQHQAIQAKVLQSALTLGLARAGQGDSSSESSAAASDILSRHLAAPAARGRTLELILRDALAEAMGLKFDLPAANVETTERMKPLLHRLRASGSPAEQLDILRAAIRDLNADIHRLSQAEQVDDDAIDMAITDLQDMQNLLPSQFDLGRFEQAASLAGSRLNAFEESRLLRTWEFSMASAGLDVDQQGELHSVLVSELLAPHIASIAAADGSISSAKRGELSGLLISRISDRIKSDLVYQHMTEVPQELDLDGRSSRGGWVLFDRGGAADPSQWRRIDTEHDLRMALRGLVRQVSREVAQGRSSTASREHVKALGNQLEASLRGADFERTVNRTTDRATTYKTALVDSLVNALVGDKTRQSGEARDWGMFAIDDSLAWAHARGLAMELRQCLGERLVFTAAPGSRGQTRWRVHDSLAPPPAMPGNAKVSPLVNTASAQSDGQGKQLLTEQDLKATVRRILADRIAAAGHTNSKFKNDLVEIRNKLMGASLSAALEHLSPNTATSDTQVHRPVWSLAGGGIKAQVMSWMGANGQQVQLVEAADAPRGPDEFFAQLVTAVRNIRTGAAEGRPLLVGSSAHAFSLTPESWKEVLGPTASDPKVWLQKRLGPGQHLKLADMNWGTGSHPMHLAIGQVNGKLEFGWAEGDAFHVSARAKAYAQRKWNAWKGDSSGSLGAA